MSTRHSYLSTTGLIRDPSNAASVAPSTHANSGGTKPGQNRSSRKKPLTVAKAGILPLGPAFIVAIAMAFSLVFILSLSFAFVGSDDDEPKFKSLLEDIANNSPGIVLLGDNIDIDVDEPAVTIRWSVIGCGSEFVLPGSQGTHGSTSCGVPSVPLKVFVDGLSDPKFSYDPTQTPFASGTGQRLSVQNLFQFDSDHVLDVHEARLYPFDTYHLTSTLRAASSDGDQPIVLSALTTITMTSRFIVNPTDVASYMNTSDYDAPSRDVQLYITRPGEARAWTLLLFGVSWMLAHFTVALVVLARTLQGGEERLLRYLLLAFVILLSIPQLRNAMPDAPGFDGVLIDNIGFFPQMLVSAISIVCLLTILAKQGLQSSSEAGNCTQWNAQITRQIPPGPVVSKGLEKLRRQGSSVDFRHLRSWSRTAFTNERNWKETGAVGLGVLH